MVESDVNEKQKIPSVLKDAGKGALIGSALGSLAGAGIGAYHGYGAGSVIGGMNNGFWNSVKFEKGKVDIPKLSKKSAIIGALLGAGVGSAPGLLTGSIIGAGTGAVRKGLYNKKQRNQALEIINEIDKENNDMNKSATELVDTIYKEAGLKNFWNNLKGKKWTGAEEQLSAAQKALNKQSIAERRYKELLNLADTMENVPMKGLKGIENIKKGYIKNKVLHNAERIKNKLDGIDLTALQVDKDEAINALKKAKRNRYIAGSAIGAGVLGTGGLIAAKSASELIDGIYKEASNKDWLV